MASSFFYLIVWKDSKNKRFVYDVSDVKKKSIKTIIHKGSWQRIKFTSFFAGFRFNSR